MENFIWLKPNSTKDSGEFKKIVFDDSEKVLFQREVGFYLGSIEKCYLRNPDACLEQLDWYYSIAKQGLDESPVCDPWSVVFFRTLTELLANFIQTFRALKGKEPSKEINKDLRTVRA